MRRGGPAAHTRSARDADARRQLRPDYQGADLTITAKAGVRDTGGANKVYGDDGPRLTGNAQRLPGR